jgi:hypothetical protein
MRTCLQQLGLGLQPLIIYSASILNKKNVAFSGLLLYSNRILLCEKSANLYAISMRIL